MCWSGVQVEGTAKNKGLVVDAPGQRVAKGRGKYVEIWDTSDDGYAFQFFIDFEKRQIQVKPYDQK